MIQNWQVTRSDKARAEEERELIVQIATRASELADEYGVKYTVMTATMDLIQTHKDTPLDLAGLLAADDGNFGHDVFGIRRHMNHTTGKLEGCFVPRYALPQKSSANAFPLGGVLVS